VTSAPRTRRDEDGDARSGPVALDWTDSMVEYQNI